MKSAKLLARRSVLVPVGQLGLIEPPTMGLDDRFDVQPFLVAEVVVDGRDIRPGRLTDVADRGGLEAPLGEQLAGGVDDPFPRCV